MGREETNISWTDRKFNSVEPRLSSLSTLTNFRDPVHGQVASTTAQQATACTAVILVVQNNTTARAGSEEVPVVCGARVGVNLHLKHSRGSTTCDGFPLRPECQMERAICGTWTIANNPSHHLHSPKRGGINRPPCTSPSSHAWLQFRIIAKKN